MASRSSAKWASGRTRSATQSLTDLGALAFAPRAASAARMIAAGLLEEKAGVLCPTQRAEATFAAT